MYKVVGDTVNLKNSTKRHTENFQKMAISVLSHKWLIENQYKSENFFRFHLIEIFFLFKTELSTY